MKYSTHPLEQQQPCRSGIILYIALLPSLVDWMIICSDVPINVTDVCMCMYVNILGKNSLSTMEAKCFSGSKR